MKALSIRQPWAWLIIHGYKDIENRDWRYPPSYRGKLAIHAAKTFDYDGWLWVRETFPDIPLPGAGEQLLASMIQSKYDRGGFVGTCRLSDVVTDDRSPWFFGEYGFKLRMPKPAKFIPYPGQLGLFDVPQDIQNQLAA